MKKYSVIIAGEVVVEARDEDHAQQLVEKMVQDANELSDYQLDLQVSFDKC